MEKVEEKSESFRLLMHTLGTASLQPPPRRAAAPMPPSPERTCSTSSTSLQAGFPMPAARNPSPREAFLPRLENRPLHTALCARARTAPSSIRCSGVSPANILPAPRQLPCARVSQSSAATGELGDSVSSPEHAPVPAAQAQARRAGPHRTPCKHMGTAAGQREGLWACAGGSRWGHTGSWGRGCVPVWALAPTPRRKQSSRSGERESAELNINSRANTGSWDQVVRPPLQGRTALWEQPGEGGAAQGENRWTWPSSTLV